MKTEELEGRSYVHLERVKTSEVAKHSVKEETLEIEEIEKGSASDNNYNVSEKCTIQGWKSVEVEEDRVGGGWIEWYQL